CPDLPIIVVSEPQGETVVIEALTHGAADYVLLHDLDRLPSAIERAMRQAEERAQHYHADERLKKSIRELQFINETIIEASRTQDIDALCKLIVERVHSVNPKAYVFVSLYDRKLDAIRLRAMKVDQPALEQALAVVNIDLQKVTFQPNEIGDAAHFYTSGHLECLPDGIATLLAGKIPRVLARRVVRLWGIDGVYTVGFALDDQPYGGVIILTRGEDIRYRSAIETLTSHFSLIIQRQQAEEARRESEKRLSLQSLVLDQIQDMVTITDLEGNVTYVNQAEVKTLKRSRENLLSDHIESFGEDPSRGATQQEILEKTLAQGEWRGEVVNYDADGQPVMLDVRTQTIFNDRGERIALCGISTDITERKQMEEALRESEARLKMLIQASPDIICFKDGEGRWLEANQADLELFHLEGVDYKGKRDSELAEYTLPIYREAFLTCEQTDEIAWQQEEISRSEETIPLPDGSSKIYDVIKVPLFYEDGRRKGLIVLGRDITERKRAEEALRASEARYRTIFETAAVSLWEEDFSGVKAAVDQLRAQGVTDIAGYLDKHPEFVEQAAQMIEVMDVNQTTVRMFGAKDKAEMLGDLGRIFVPETAKILRQEILAIAAGQSHFQGETINRTLDGKRLNVILTMTIPETPEKFNSVLISIMDITQRKRAEEERERLLARNRAQVRRIQQIIETVPEGVFSLDEENRVVLINPAAERHLALLADAGAGDTLSHLGDRTLPELLTSPPRQGMWHEVRYEDNGDHRIFEVISRPMSTGTPEEKWVVVIRDVTQERERRARIQQQERLAAVGQLAAGIAHDFNNLMAVIVLYTQMELRNPDLSSKLRDHLRTIVEQAERATDLVQQILDFGRRTALKRQPMSLVPFLKEQVKLLRRTIPENIEISLDYEASDYVINADPTRIQQAIMNLALNARDAMRHGGHLRIALAGLDVTDRASAPLPEMDAGPWIQIAVSDTGVGIPPEALPHIFEPFFTTKGPGEGSGLGLAQVYGIVRLHAGEIDVISEVGEGTTFTIYLPAVLVTPRSGRDMPVIDLVSGHQEVILIVEDDAAMREALIGAAESLNYRVLTARDGQAALAILDDHAADIDLILSDLVMPEVGGQALLRELKRRGLKIPVVILTGHPMDQELSDLKAQGLAGWLRKPLDLDQLAQMLAQALHERL
ncbi:MAG: PAS domain S-box protein, partial [Chloroflexi bacterium]|nr:PAS domain S-box protein [Chloroflexota bacterium]